MAALNQAETKALSDAQSIIATVLVNGYDPKKAETSSTNRDAQFRRLLEKSKNELNMVHQMKGYYPS